MRELVETGDVRSYADLARLARVTRPRATQILNLLLLAPDLQEAVLHLPRVVDGRDPVTERGLRPLVATPDWGAQREMFRALVPTGSERVVLEVSADPGPHVSGGVAMGAAPGRTET